MGADARVSTVCLPAYWNSGHWSKGPQHPGSHRVQGGQCPQNSRKLSNTDAGPPKKSSYLTSAQHNLCPSVENPQVRAVYDAYILVQNSTLNRVSKD